MKNTFTNFTWTKNLLLFKSLLWMQNISVTSFCGSCQVDGCANEQVIPEDNENYSVNEFDMIWSHILQTFRVFSMTCLIYVDEIFLCLPTMLFFFKLAFISGESLRTVGQKCIKMHQIFNFWQYLKILIFFLLFLLQKRII